MLARGPVRDWTRVVLLAAPPLGLVSSSMWRGEHGAHVHFMETVCDPDTQHQRLEDRQVHENHSDGRIELMQRQRTEFESPADDIAHIFERVSTDGPIDDIQSRVVTAPADARRARVGLGDGRNRCEKTEAINSAQ